MREITKTEARKHDKIIKKYIDRKMDKRYKDRGDGLWWGLEDIQKALKKYKVKIIQT